MAKAKNIKKIITKKTLQSTKKNSRITPFLMLNADASEAANFYVSIFKNSKIVNENSVTATFILDGQKFHAFNGGSHFKFTEALSLFVSCETQEEVDYYWDKLTADGGAESMCGWLRDKYGVSWQIIPTKLMQLTGHKDSTKAERARQAMFKMKKIIITDLENI